MSPAWRQSPWRKRLPLLLVLVIGFAVWNSSLFPQPRHLSWQVPADSRIRGIEIQLWNGKTLLRRERRAFTSTPFGLWQWDLSLRPGDYRADIFIDRVNPTVSNHVSQVIKVGEERELFLQDFAAR